jgi:hypothetical protein
VGALADTWQTDIIGRVTIMPLIRGSLRDRDGTNVVDPPGSLGPK